MKHKINELKRLAADCSEDSEMTRAGLADTLSSIACELETLEKVCGDIETDCSPKKSLTALEITRLRRRVKAGGRVSSDELEILIDAYIERAAYLISERWNTNPKPLGKCPGCLADVYTLEGRCGICDPIEIGDSPR